MENTLWLILLLAKKPAHLNSNDFITQFEVSGITQKCPRHSLKPAALQNKAPFYICENKYGPKGGKFFWVPSWTRT